MNYDESKYYASPRWTWELLDCAMPMTFDTYSNCAFQCVYCFSFFQRAVGLAATDYLQHKVRAVNVEKIKRMFLEPDEYAGQFAWYIKKKMVLQWGGLSDGFDWYERTLRKSLELLRFFREIDYPISISTKGVWYLDDPEYVECFRGAKNVQMKLSIITNDDTAAKRIESGTASPTERFAALKRLKDLGVGVTTWRFRPFIIGLSERNLEDAYQTAVDCGVDSMTTEFLCLERRSSNNLRERCRIISEVVGYDVWDFYIKNSRGSCGLMRLNYDLKRPYVAEMMALAEKYHIPFFISDAHHKEKSAGTGCCGLPNDGPLSNINRGQFAEAILIAKKNGLVRWSDIATLAEPFKEIPFRNAEGYNSGGSHERAKFYFSTMFDFMRTMWNTPDSYASPARYFGGALVPSELDANGDIIYIYNKPFVEEGKRITAVSDLKQKLQDDGGQFGHVAFPIFMLHASEDLIAALEQSRLNATMVVETEQDGFMFDTLVAQTTEELLTQLRQDPPAEYVWIIDGNNFKQSQKSLRARLSGIEQQPSLNQYPDSAFSLVKI